jgi:AraC-like DNA-binding protein
MAPEFEPTDPEMRAAYRLIAAGAPPGAPLVPWLGRALGMSERTLRRRFDVAFGYGPKVLDRILRYQRYLRLAENSSEGTAILALESGYSDQAHLIRESRRLTGSPPGVLNRLALSRR